MTKYCLCLLHPELIHADEGHRVLGLELVPLIEVAHGRVGREACSIGSARRSGEAEKCETMRAHEGGDVRDRELLLLHIEQQIAALAGREEVRVLRHIAQRRALLEA